MTRKIQTLNAISKKGLSRLPESYVVSNDGSAPDAILVRSQVMHEMVIPASVLAIGRAGRRHQQHPDQGDERARRRRLQRAGRQRQRGQGTGDRWHAARHAQHLPGAQLRRRPARRRRVAAQTGRGRQEALRRPRARRQHTGHRRPRRDRLDARRCGDQARHERHRLRPGNHRRRRLAIAFERQKSGQRR